jgi:hypothetical protein
MQSKGGVDPFTNRIISSPEVASPTSQFQWEVAKDPAFENLLRNSLSKNPVCPNVGLPAGVYYCRIRDSVKNKLVKQYKFSVKP